MKKMSTYSDWKRMVFTEDGYVFTELNDGTMVDFIDEDRQDLSFTSSAELDVYFTDIEADYTVQNRQLLESLDSEALKAQTPLFDLADELGSFLAKQRFGTALIDNQYYWFLMGGKIYCSLLPSSFAVFPEDIEVTADAIEFLQLDSVFKSFENKETVLLNPDTLKDAFYHSRKPAKA